MLEGIFVKITGTGVPVSLFVFFLKQYIHEVVVGGFMKSCRTRHKSVSVVMSDVTAQRLHEAAKRSGRKVRHEAMLRLAHSLKHVPDIEEIYWEILKEN